MKAEPNTDEFHDSDAGDIYDLYNACNGVLHDGLLDIRKLEEYSPKDAEELNVTRLREVWTHAASGCAECKDAVSALSSLREAAKV